MTTPLAHDEARREVAARGLTPAAAAHLTRDALGAIDFAVLAPVKKLIKQYFSAEPWTEADEEALAGYVGDGDGWWRHALDDDFALEFGWRAGTFRLFVSRGDTGPDASRAETFASPVTPEATPNPRSIRFVTPPIHDGPSRWYASAEGVDDPRVGRLFNAFDDVDNVLVGPTFVAVGIHRPERWEAILDPMLVLVADEFAAGGDTPERVDVEGVAPQSTPAVGPAPEPRDADRALERAWKDLGARDPQNPADLERLLGEASSSDRAVRQVVARLLAGAASDVAERTWSVLLDDPSRVVRRAVVDAMVDTGHEALRPLFERALHDADAWTRWKALRGLVELGVAASGAAVVSLADDPDFRVRLEAARALAV